MVEKGAYLHAVHNATRSVLKLGCGIIHCRRNLHPPTSRVAQEEPNLKFVDTAAKNGSAGRYQTRAEKARVLARPPPNDNAA